MKVTSLKRSYFSSVSLARGAPLRLIDYRSHPCRRYRRGGLGTTTLLFSGYTSQHSPSFLLAFFTLTATPTHLAASLEVRGAVDVPLSQVNPVEVLLLHRSAAAALDSKLGSRDFYSVGCRTSASAPRLVPRTPGGMFASTIGGVRTPCDPFEEGSCDRHRGRQVLGLAMF